MQAFFILSGYLITRIVASGMAVKTWDYADFMRARARRLMPALVVMLLTVTLSGWLFDRPSAAELSGWALIAGFYLTDLARLTGAGSAVVGHTWTLAVEMQFYLVWPFVLSLVMRASQPGVVLATLAAGLACLWPFSPPAWVEINPAPLVAGGALAFSRLPTLTWATRALSWPVLARIGLLSYGIYLWHLPVDAVCHAMAWPARFAADFTLSTALAALSYLTIERWAGCAKTPLWPRRSPAGLTEAAA